MLFVGAVAAVFLVVFLHLRRAEKEREESIKKGVF
jgi:hypothetical protein